MTFEEAQYIIIGMEDGWFIGTQKDYEEAKKYVIDHVGELREISLFEKTTNNKNKEL